MTPGEHLVNQLQKSILFWVVSIPVRSPDKAARSQAYKHQIGLNGGLSLISFAAVLVFCSRQSSIERSDLLHF